MAAAEMSDPQALAAFLDKWRERWPEWSVAEVFVPADDREMAVAWFALLQEFTDAAWGGSDPRPGEAKLGWWAEELLGWQQRRRRHPLGVALQSAPAPWGRLGMALPVLLAAREAAVDREQAIATISPLVEAAAAVGSVLFAGNCPEVAAQPLLAQHLLLRGDAAAPLAVRARLGEALSDHALGRAWAGDLLASWPRMRAVPRPERVFAALLRERLRRFSNGGGLGQPIPRMSSLWLSWRAARG